MLRLPWCSIQKFFRLSIKESAMNQELMKLFTVSALAAALAACGGSDNKSNDNGGKASYNTSANPSFTFDQTTYVGAVDPAATGAMWYEFAMAGSYPATAAAINTASTAAGTFTPNVTFTPDMSAITPAADCPSIVGNSLVSVDKASASVVVDGKTFAVCEVAGTFTADATLSNDVVWSLKGRVNVGNGNGAQTANTTFDSAVLTVEAGTVFMNKAGSSLVVTRGSQINAVGTAAQPIVMSGIATTDNFAADEEWGGLVLQGYAYHNKCGDFKTETVCNIPGEGASGFFGGFDNYDSSGTLKYVIVTEAGLELDSGDELNGIGFMGVGYGTTIDYIQIHGNKDDGVEFFGGAVDAKHLVLTGNKDDDIDWDEGYVGNIQYALVIKYQNQEKANSNHVFELDTKGDNVESAYQESNPTVANVTAIVDLSTADYGNDYIGDGIHLKEGSEGRFFNILIAGDVDNCVFIKDSNVQSTVAKANNNAIDSAFQNVKCGTIATLSNGSTYTLDNLGTLASVTLNDNLAETAIGAVTATIASAEVDGTAN